MEEKTDSNNRQTKAIVSQSSMSMAKEEELAPSKIQQLASELFRIGLCRNDDYNLAQSSVTKNVQQVSSGVVTKKKPENKDKLIADMRNREEDRVNRENEITKELTTLNKVYLQGPQSQGIEKQLKKMIRKCLMLTLDIPVGGQKI